MATTTFKLPSGGSVAVVSSQAVVPVAPGGVVEASAVGDRAEALWDEALKTVAEMCEVAVAQMRGATKDCKEVAVEFGVEIGGKASVWVVEGTGKANLKVTLKW